MSPGEFVMGKCSGKDLRGYNKKPINNSPEMKASTVSPILYL